MSLNNTIKTNIEGLERLMSEKDVVNLIYRSSQNNHLWAFRLPYMNIVQIPADLKDYSLLSIKKFEDVDLYVFNG